jgi:glucose/arabinose dehydrogenase
VTPPCRDRTGRCPLLAIVALLAAGLSSTLPAAAQVQSLRVVAGLEWPVYVTAPAGDEHRLFVVLQNGLIRIVKDGVLLAEPFLDIDALVPDVSTYDERGLLGLAFHPDYASNGTFYVNYTDGNGDTVIARYAVSADPDRADATSALVILTVDQPYANHNGGTLAFSPQDGHLYVGMGDGGSVGDPQNRAQDPGTLLGKLLRLDVDAGTPYAIPDDNPYAGTGLPLDEIWASGLRNPFRFSFDRLTGDLYIADVGQSTWEEIDVQPAASPGGENYGWRLMEGYQCYNPPGDCNDGSLVLPVHVYGHDLGCSVTGGVVYRGSALPALQGLYFFADWCSARIWSLRWQEGVAADLQDWTERLAPGGGLAIESIAAIGEDGLGEIYIVDRSPNRQGEIYKLVPAGPQPADSRSWGRLKSGYR